MPQIYLGLLDYRKGCGPESCQGRSRRAVLYILDRIPVHSLKAHPSRPKYILVPERACKKDENDIKLGQENLCQILYLSIKGELQPIYSDSKLTQPLFGKILNLRKNHGIIEISPRCQKVHLLTAFNLPYRAAAGGIPADGDRTSPRSYRIALAPPKSEAAFVPMRQQSPQNQQGFPFPVCRTERPSPWQRRCPPPDVVGYWCARFPPQRTAPAIQYR